MQISDMAAVSKCIGADLTRKVLAKCGIEPDYDWKAHTEESLAKLLGGLAESDRDAYDRIESRFTHIADLKADSKNAKLMLEYLAETNLLPAEAAEREKVLKLRSTAKIAAYCISVMDDNRIRILRERTIITARRGNDWKNYELELHATISPDCVKSHEAELAECLRKYISTKEGCAEHAVPMSFTTGTKQAFVLKMDDRTTESEEWNETARDFSFIERCPSVKLAVTLDTESGRLAVHYREGKQSRKIGELFCDTALGKENYTIAGEVAYDLSKFLERQSSDFGGSEDGVIKSVSIIELYIQLAGMKNSRRTYYELDKNLYDTIRKELAHVASPPHFAGTNRPIFPVGTIAKRVKLRATYDTATRRDVHRNFELSEVSESGFQDAPRPISDAMHSLLEKWGVTKKKATSDDTVPRPAGR